MTNSVLFTSPKQSKRLKDLEEELRFRARVVDEAKRAFEAARQDLAKAVDEIGAPADGRIVRFIYDDEAAQSKLPAGIYWETFELKWDPKSKVFLPRTRDEGLAWAKEMDGKGHPVEVPVPPTTLPTE